MTLEAIKYDDGVLEILDQLLLPKEHKYIPILSVEDGWKAIKLMQVRNRCCFVCNHCSMTFVTVVKANFSNLAVFYAVLVLQIFVAIYSHFVNFHHDLRIVIQL